jgi:hypothetical protein
MKQEAFALITEGFYERNIKPNAMSYSRALAALMQPRRDNARQEYRLNALIAGNPPPPDSLHNDSEREWVLEKSWAVYEQFEKYRRVKGWPERWEELQVKFVRNKWLQLGIGQYERKLEYFIYRDLIRGLARYFFE